FPPATPPHKINTNINNKIIHEKEYAFRVLLTRQASLPIFLSLDAIGSGIGSVSQATEVHVALIGGCGRRH
ncbi:hypothetical protein, partial [Gluconobacter japonicus]|uniref:hypothetical protein n=1 Tax=Gluconobacter japonicus TaxID=376620 RepID=UPI0022318C79